MNGTVKIGVVIIGRNEGKRLVRCLNSVDAKNYNVVYVDSHSTDQSVQNAKDAGAEIVNLDMSKPFSAARARNAGWTFLIKQFPDIEFIQFIDGDCILQPNWLPEAIAFLILNSSAAAVCGRRKEILPSTSIYNQFCDDEWNTPIGETKSCGGDALIRVVALKDVNGYTNHFIAGEEPEMCYRMRKKGWRIHRIDCDMTMHDAAMTKFSQWWKRAKRAGFAYALSADAYGMEEERFGVKPVIRALSWSSLTLVLCVSSFFQPFLLLGYLVFPAQAFRVALKSKPVTIYTLKKSGFLLLAKFAETSGIISFYKKKLSREPFKIIEYK